MISIKTPREIELMRVAGEIVGDTHKYLIPYLKQLDEIGVDAIIVSDPAIIKWLKKILI